MARTPAEPARGQGKAAVFAQRHWLRHGGLLTLPLARHGLASMPSAVLSRDVLLFSISNSLLGFASSPVPHWHLGRVTWASRCWAEVGLTTLRGAEQSQGHRF